MLQKSKYKLGICILLVLFMLTSFGPFAIAVQQPASYNEVFRFFDYYYDYSIDDSLFPDYYAGVYFDSNDVATFLVTDDSHATVSLIKTICENDNVEIEKVSYSFNQLLETQETLLEMRESLNLVSAKINILQNNIIASVSEMPLQQSRNSITSNTSNSMEDMIEWTVVSDIADNSKLGNESIQIESENSAQDSITSNTTYRAGLRTSFQGVGYQNGTISFLALDGSGRKLIFTHGHDISEYGTSVSVNGDTLTFYQLEESDACDASFALLPNSATLTNYIASTGSRIRGTMTRTQFISMGSASVNFYGQATGSIQSSYFEDDGDYGFLLSRNGTMTRDGDSGGPIFVGSSSNYRLVGIVKSGDESSYSMGVYLSSIKEAYEESQGRYLYVFVNDTSYS